MDIEALRSYIAFVETGSFTRASLQVHRTQSAISQQMKKLEEQTGKVLFVKAGRKLVLTDDGRFLLGYARQLVSLNDDALIQLQRKNSSRPLILGCPDDYVDKILPKVVMGIKQVAPDLSIDIRCDNSAGLRKQMDNGDIDVAIVTSKSQNEGYFLQNDRGVWAYNGNKQALQALFNQPKIPLVLYDKTCHFYHAAVDGFNKMGKAYEIAAISSSASAIVSLVKSGRGITTMAEVSLSGLHAINQNDCPFLLPFLPEVTIELVLSANAHPGFGRAQVAAVAKTYTLD